MLYMTTSDILHSFYVMWVVPFFFDSV